MRIHVLATMVALGLTGCVSNNCPPAPNAAQAAPVCTLENAKSMSKEDAQKLGVQCYFLAQESRLSNLLTGTGVEIVRGDKMLTLNLPNTVTFETSKDVLKPAGDKTMADIAKVLAEFEQSQVTVTGHTDNTGDHAFNVDLSKRRAKTVADKLTAGGVAAARTTTAGVGPDQPVADNATKEGRAQNRRVTIELRAGDIDPTKLTAEAAAKMGPEFYMKSLRARLTKELHGSGIGIDQQGEVVTLSFPSNVTFDTSKSTLKPEGVALVDKTAMLLAEFHRNKAEVIGHTDNTGSVQLNQDLSTQRAQSVANQLQAKGVAADRLSAKGVAAEQPVASNDTVEGRAQNRRVTLQLTPNFKK